MITEKQFKLLNMYKDRAYISSILSEKSYNHYSKIKTVVNIPLIFLNSFMCIINSIDVNHGELKIPNIVINSLTTLILSLIHNYKIDEKIISFKNGYTLYNKLCHTIEDYLINNQEELSADVIKNLVSQYDNIQDNIPYNYPDFIKESIKKEYENKRCLPISISSMQQNIEKKNINTPMSVVPINSHQLKIKIPKMIDIRESSVNKTNNYFEGSSMEFPESAYKNNNSDKSLSYNV